LYLDIRAAISWRKNKNPTQRVSLVQSTPHHHLIEN